MSHRAEPTATILDRITTDMSAVEIIAECRDVKGLQKLRSDQLSSIFALILSKSTPAELEAIGRKLDAFVASRNEGLAL